MNKLIIPIIVFAIIAAGIGAYFIFQKPVFPEPAASVPPQTVENTGAVPVSPNTSLAPRWMPITGASWQIQFALSDIKASSNADLYDMDMYDTTPEKINELHTAGKRVICYVNAGAYEDWRVDAADFPAAILGKDYHGWKGEKWLDIRRIDLLSPLLSKRIDLCAAKGFDGIEFDNVNGFENDTGFPLTADDQIRFNRWLADESHKRGLSVGLKNDSMQVKELVRTFDFAITENCAAEGWCNNFQPFIDAGKPVFVIEYKEVIDSTKFQKLCQTYAPEKYSMIFKNQKLDAFAEYCIKNVSADDRRRILKYLILFDGLNLR